MLDKRTLTRLEALRTALTSADSAGNDSFSRVFHAFLDVAEDPALLRASKPTKDPIVRGALEQVVRNITGDDAVELQRVRLLRVADAGLIHGGFFFGAAMGNLFFFEREEKGLTAIHQGGGRMLYTRLTLTRLPPGAVPVKGPVGPQ